MDAERTLHVNIEMMMGIWVQSGSCTDWEDPSYTASPKESALTQGSALYFR